MTIKVKYKGRENFDYKKGETYYLNFGIQQSNANFAKGELFVHRIGEKSGQRGFWSMKSLEFFHENFDLI